MRLRVERVALELLHRALGESIDEFRREAIRAIDRLVGCDTGIGWRAPPGEGAATIVGFPQDIWLRYLANATSYDAEMAELNSAAGRFGVVQDIDHMSLRERSRSTFYGDIIGPIGIGCYLVAPLVRSNRLVGVMNVGRGGRRARFRTRDIEVVKQLVHVLTVGEALLAKPSLPTQSAHRAHLTGRERDVIELMRVGLSNREIATHLTMSSNTVRNHLASVYAKTGATNRLELVRFLEEGIAMVPRRGRGKGR